MSKRRNRDLAAVRGAERSRVIAERGLHYWSPEARSIPVKSKRAERDACRRKGRDRWDRNTAEH